MNEIWNAVARALWIGLQPEQLGFAQLTLRALIIFVVALVLMRIGHKRSLTRKTAFDTAFVIIIGAVLARAINGSAPFFQTIGISCLLVLLHWLLALCASHWPTVGSLIKGRPDVLVRDGKILSSTMAQHKVSLGDLEEDLHLCGHRSVEQIALARLERSGDISFVEK